jgi:hypothetical protein
MIGFNLKDRLVAFGCSLTYGYGLPGCYNIRTEDQGIFPSKLAWPYLLAKLLDKKSTNLSDSGCSNKDIWNRVVNFKFKKNDTVIILWTYRYRNSVLKDKHTAHYIKPYDVENDIISKNYYEHIFEDYDATMMTRLFISQVNYFLKEKNINTYNLVIDKVDTNLLTLSDNTIPHIPVYFKDFFNNYPKGVDGDHPGVEAHADFAKEIYKHVN